MDQILKDKNEMMVQGQEQLKLGFSQVSSFFNLGFSWDTQQGGYKWQPGANHKQPAAAARGGEQPHPQEAPRGEPPHPHPARQQQPPQEDKAAIEERNRRALSGALKAALAELAATSVPAKAHAWEASQGHQDHQPQHPHSIPLSMPQTQGHQPLPQPKQGPP
jgi:hypothetical protein